MPTIAEGRWVRICDVRDLWVNVSVCQFVYVYLRARVCVRVHINVRVSAWVCLKVLVNIFISLPNVTTEQCRDPLHCVHPRILFQTILTLITFVSFIIIIAYVLVRDGEDVRRRRRRCRRYRRRHFLRLELSWVVTRPLLTWVNHKAWSNLFWCTPFLVDSWHDMTLISFIGRSVCLLVELFCLLGTTVSCVRPWFE